MSFAVSYGSRLCVTSHKYNRKTIAKAKVFIADPKGEEQRIQNHQLSLPEIRISEIVKRQSRRSRMTSTESGDLFHPMFLQEAYERCRNICAEYAKTFYLGTQLMTQERQKAIWAIYGTIITSMDENAVSHNRFVRIWGWSQADVWCRRTDELVDGPNAGYMSCAVLDRWEERIENIFNNRPYDMLDAALSRTIQKFPLDIKPFKDMIEGMRMDTRKTRYSNFQELYQYCYYVAGTVGLMSVPVMGIAPESPLSAQTIYHAALYLGVGNQLTNILRDVGEDASRGRVYLPQDELATYGLSDKDIFEKKVSDEWREFMKEQIRRARSYFNLAEEGASHLDQASRWPVWASLILYRKILDAIEENEYDNLNKRAYVGRLEKIATLPLAYTRAQSVASLAFY